MIISSINPVCVAGKKSQQCGTSLFHSGQEKLTEEHQPISEGISREPCIIISHMGPQKIAERINFDMMVA